MTSTSKEYAVALYELAAETGQEQQQLGDLKLVLQVFDQTPGLTDFLTTPAISRQVRLETLEQAFDQAVSQHTISFLALLCQHNAVDRLADCVAEYEKIVHYRQNRVRGVVKSVVPLTDDQKQRLAAALSAKYRKTVELTYQLQPDLIGGLSVELDGALIDGSVKRRLQTIKELIGE